MRHNFILKCISNFSDFARLTVGACLFVCLAGCGYTKGGIISSTGLDNLKNRKFDVSFEQTAVSLTEGGSAQLLVVLSAPQTTDFSVALAWASTNGDELTRFQTLPLSVVVPAGSLSKSFVLNTIDDAIVQPTKTYKLILVTTSVNANLTHQQVTITLADNDTVTVANPALSLSDATTTFATYARSVSTTIGITADPTAARWCVSETQVAPPALGTSTCTGGTGSSNGWFTVRPSTFSLSAGDGLKRVYVWIADASSHVNAGTVSATITLDTVLPATPSAALADPNSNSTTSTNQATVGLAITGDTGAVKWCALEQAAATAPPIAPLFNAGCWVSTRPTTQSLSATGSRKLYLYTQDVAGNVSSSAGLATIAYSTTAAVTPALVLKDPGTNSTSYAKQIGVTATITSDSDAVKWCLSETQTTQPSLGTSACTGGTGTAAGWLTTRPTSFTLSTGDGSKTVYLWTANTANNVSSAIVSATIILDTVAPTVPSSLALSSPSSSPNTVATPSISVGGVTSGDSITLYSNSSCTTSVSSATPATGTSVVVTTTTLAEAAYTFYAASVDAAGNASPCSTASVAYIYDSTPLGSFSITGITGASDSTLDGFLNGGVNPIINWSASANAVNYDVTVLQADGTTVQCATQSTAALSYSFSSCTLVAGSSYKVHLVAKKTTGSSTLLGASNTNYSFTVNIGPTAATIATLYVMSGSTTAVDVLTGASCGISGCTLSIQSSANGSIGTTTYTGNNVSYVATSGTSGVDSVSYVISDGRGGSATGSIGFKVMTPMTWTGNAADGNWSTAGNWCGSVNGTHTSCLGTGSIPSSSDDVIFDSTCVSSCSTSIPVGGLTLQSLSLNSGYSGTLTQPSGASNTLMVNGAFSQASGTYVGGNANVQFSSFALSGGTHMLTSAQTKDIGNWSVTNTPTFSANGGSIDMFEIFAAIIFKPGTVQYNNLKFEGYLGSFDFQSGAVAVGGALTLVAYDNRGAIRLDNGVINLSGNLILNDGGGSGFGGNGSIKLVGNLSGQTITAQAGAPIPSLEIATGVNNVAYVGTLSIYSNYVVTSVGTLSAGTSTVNMISAYGAYTFNPGSQSLANVTFSTGLASFDFGGQTLSVTGLLTLNEYDGRGYSSLNNGNVLLGGNLSATATANQGNASGFAGSVLIKLVGNSVDQTITGTAVSKIPSLEIAAGSHNVTLSGTIQVLGDYKLTSVGTLTTTGSTLAFYPNGPSKSVTCGSATYAAMILYTSGSTTDLNGSNCAVSGTLTVQDLSGVNDSDTHSSSAVNNGTFLASGDIQSGPSGNYGVDGTALFKLVGNPLGQTITGSANSQFSNLEIATGTYPVTLSGSINVNHDLKFTSYGTLTGASSTALSFGGSYGTINTSFLGPAGVTFSSVRAKEHAHLDLYSDLSTTALSMGGNTIIYKNGHVLTVNGVVVGTGSLYGGTVN